MYFTNATIYPDEEVIDMWKSFKKVTLYLSVDGVGRVNDYVRFPSQWADVESNTHKYMKLCRDLTSVEVIIFSTISVYNVWSIDELRRWSLYLEKEYKYPPSFQFIYSPIGTPSSLTIQNFSFISKGKF